MEAGGEEGREDEEQAEEWVEGEARIHLIWEEEEGWLEEEVEKEAFPLPLVLPFLLGPLHLTWEGVEGGREGGREEEKDGIGKGIEAGKERPKRGSHHEEEDEEEEEHHYKPWEDRTIMPAAAHRHHSQLWEGG